MKFPILAVLVLAAGSASAGERFTVKDQGSFAPTGRHVEFADRYGWRSYEARFDFSIDESGRGLGEGSTLNLSVKKKDGGSWSYRCRADGRREMWANVNKLYGKGTMVVAECRIRPDKFASAVGLEDDMVGEPTFVFTAMVNGDKAEAGIQKGFYFLAAGQIQASEMNQYATQNDDPSELSVLFASSQLASASALPAHYHHYYQPMPRFVP